MRFATATPGLAGHPGAGSGWSTVEVVVPVQPGGRGLAAGVAGLASYLDAAFPFSAHVVVAATRGGDCDWVLARELAATFAQVSLVEVDPPVRGPALGPLRRQRASAALACLDAAAIADPPALLPLVAPLLAGACDVTVGDGAAALSSAAAAVLDPLAGEQDWFFGPGLLATARRARLRIGEAGSGR